MTVTDVEQQQIYLLQFYVHQLKPKHPHSHQKTTAKKLTKLPG